MVQKLLMEIPDSDLRDLHQGTETGMGFHIIEGPHGFLAVYIDGVALPLYSDPRYYCLDDVLAGTPIPTERDNADSGFGAVGRYALPIPLPASHVFQYELPQGTTIEVGTVGPNFGQSGGGVEIHLPNATSATRIGNIRIP